LLNPLGKLCDISEEVWIKVDFSRPGQEAFEHGWLAAIVLMTNQRRAAEILENKAKQ
jgi:hypothetical protein